MAYRQSLGRRGEDIAAVFMQDQGYSLLERNARTAYGELDLVVRDQDVLVFVEVKTRSSSSLAPPEAGLTARKQTHLRAAAQAYVQAHPDLPGDYRIDVIAILGLRRGSAPEIVHFENAVYG